MADYNYLLNRARELRSQIEVIAPVMADEDALNFSELFQTWSGNGVAYSVGTRVRYDGVLYRVLTAHTSQWDWTPAAAPSLFAEVLIADPNVIPDWKQPDSTNAYKKGDKVKFNGAVYESAIDNNVWSPIDYPAGWKKVEE